MSAPTEPNKMNVARALWQESGANRSGLSRRLNKSGVIKDFLKTYTQIPFDAFDKDAKEVELYDTEPHKFERKPDEKGNHNLKRVKYERTVWTVCEPDKEGWSSRRTLDKNTPSFHAIQKYRPSKSDKDRDAFDAFAIVVSVDVLFNRMSVSSDKLGQNKLATKEVCTSLFQLWQKVHAMPGFENHKIHFDSIVDLKPGANKTALLKGIKEVIQNFYPEFRAQFIEALHSDTKDALGFIEPEVKIDPLIGNEPPKVEVSPKEAKSTGFESKASKASEASTEPEALGFGVGPAR